MAENKSPGAYELLQTLPTWLLAVSRRCGGRFGKSARGARRFAARFWRGSLVRRRGEGARGCFAARGDGFRAHLSCDYGFFHRQPMGSQAPRIPRVSLSRPPQCFPAPDSAAETPPESPANHGPHPARHDSRSSPPSARGLQWRGLGGRAATGIAGVGTPKCWTPPASRDESPRRPRQESQFAVA